MIRFFFLLLLLAASASTALAGMVNGYIKDEKGNPVPYASVYVKNGRQGTTSGQNGFFQLSLPEGKYILVAHHVGYAKSEKEITIDGADTRIDFLLVRQQVVLQEVVVKAGAEDPAYEIIRNAIKKRKDHLEELSHFSSEVYTREQLQLRDFPKKFMGQKVDFEDGDTSKKKILYLSESVARYSVRPPNRTKIEVLSTRVSGSSNSFGFSLPRIVNFYENSIVAEGLNARGFISPISDNALRFYRYKYEGSFVEDGVEVNRIQVIPKRKYEPLFSGHIMITENSWRIHSLQLQLLKTSQMELLDTLKIEQLYAPFNEGAWVIRNQVLYPAVKIFGFDAFGSAVTVYSKFDLDADFPPKFFDNTVMKYQAGSNKKDNSYWDSVRPLPLQPDEILDFHRKDSLEKLRQSPAYLDSLDRVRNKFSPLALLFTGESISRQKTRSTYNFSPLISAVSFNTVEGWVVNPSVSWSHRSDSSDYSRATTLQAQARYGFSSRHFYGQLNGSYPLGKKKGGTLHAGFGKNVFQFNNLNPITPLMNSFSSLIWESNYMKLYEAWTAGASYTTALGKGFRVSGGFQFQARSPLDNTTDFSWRNVKDKTYTPNYPAPAGETPMPKHEASYFTATLSWRPGEKYIEFPDRTIGLGSKYPTLALNLTKAVEGLFGSDVDYFKWRLSIQDEANFKLAGQLHYRFATGGFLQNKAAQIPDYWHPYGNQVVFATPYLSSFQAMPYYAYSNAAKIWGEGHLEQHFNGMLTNKIPGFRKLNWYLVGGAHAYWTDGGRHYEELSLGLENIFKIIRTDLVWAFDQGSFRAAYFRLSIQGIAGGN